MVYKTQGIVIKKKDLTEADRCLTVYTKDFGKILVKGKAVKKSQAKLKGHLELFMLSHLMIAQGKGLDIVTSAETINNYSWLRSNLPSLAAAYYFSELVDKLIVGPEKDEKIWQLLLAGFNQLNKEDGQTASLIKIFEAKLIQFLGYDLSQQTKNPVVFIQSVLGEKINSKKFLNVLR